MIPSGHKPKNKLQVTDNPLESAAIVLLLKMAEDLSKCHCVDVRLRILLQDNCFKCLCERHLLCVRLS